MTPNVQRHPPPPRRDRAAVSEPGQKAHASIAPLAPQRRLLRGLAVALAIWVALLLTIYATIVYPLRHGQRTDIPASVK
jgi:hypothetical protein